MKLFGEFPNYGICFWEIALAVIGAVASVASTGYGIYQGVTSDEGEAPAVTPEKTADQMRAEKLKRARLGRKQTWLTGGRDLGVASTTTPGLKSTLGG